MTSATLSAVRRPRAFGYGCALNDRLFRLAVGPGRELVIQTAPLEAPRVNTTSSPEEASAEFGLTFARSQFDGGGGLFRAHVEGAAANRYWDSKNVSVAPAEPGEFPEMRLLPTTEVTDPLPEVGLHAVAAKGSLYVAAGSVIRRTDDPTDEAPTWVDDDPWASETPGTVHDLAALGEDIYAALGDVGIHRKRDGAWEAYSDVPATRIWAAKGRILASDGRALYEVVDEGEAPDALKTLSPGESWQDVADGGSHVLAAATDGYVYAFSTDTGALVETAQTLFEGEVPRSIGQTQGIVAVGSCGRSTGRLYVGQLRDSGQLGDLQLVQQWDSSEVDCTPRRIVGTRSSLLMGTPDPDGNAYLWRYDVITGGVSRWLTLDGGDGLVRGVAIVGGKTFATVDGVGTYRETDRYAETGYLIGPLGDFYSSSDKTWVGARLETGALYGGMRAALYYTTDSQALNDPDSSAWVRVSTREAGSGGPGETAMPSVASRSLAGMVKLTAASGGSATPTVRSFSFRAYPSSGDEDVIVTLPVNVSDQVERRGRHRIRVKGRGAREFAALLGLEGRPVVARLYLSGQTVVVRGLVEEVATPIQALTTRGSVTVVSQVRIRGRRTGGSVTSGNGTFGTYRLFASPPPFGGLS